MATDPPPPLSTHHTLSRKRDLLELITAFALIVITVWLPNPPQRAFFYITFLWILITAILRRDRLRTLGLGIAGLLSSLWITAAAVLLAALAALIAQRLHILNRLHGPTPLLSHVWGYVIWSVIQQFILQGYFLLRLGRLLPGRAAPILTAAAMFSLAHLPNPILTPLTLVWGILACVLFLRYRNIYSLGLAHGILGLSVAVIVPASIHHNMCVGLGYIRYHLPRHTAPTSALAPYRSHTDHSVSTEACVTAEAPTRRS